MTVSKAEQLAKVHETALREFEKIQTALRDERLQCLQDRRFYSISGAQWEGPLGQQFENKPRFEVNKVHLAVVRIINEYRNNRIGVQFVSKSGEDADDLAESCASLFRADEQDSCAEEAYDNAFEEAVGGGFGAFRLRACYENEEDEDDDAQRVRFEPIFDADSSVFFDLDAKRQDKSDARHCYVLTAMTIDAFRDEYNEDPASWPKQIHQRMFDWLTPDVVYVAEYYAVEKKNAQVVWYKGPLGDEVRLSPDEIEEDDYAAQVDTLIATGYKESRRRKIKVNKVHKYIMCGNGILEDCGYIAGKCIPIVPVYGKRWFIDNVERCMGHVRLAKDAQRLKNMQLSKLGEYAAVSAIAKPIMTPEQIAGHQLMWADDNIDNNPYLLVNPLYDAMGNIAALGPQQYTQAPEIPPAMAALLQITEQDMSEILGRQEAGEELQPNISGKAVELVQNRLDMQSFIYISNMGKAIKRAGEIWLSMMKEIAVEPGRKMKGIDAQGKPSVIELKRKAMGDNGMEDENDLARADFDVAIDIGPTSASKKQATVRALTGMMTITQDPETIQVLSSMAMMNMEGEGIGDVREYFRRKLIKMGAVKPSEQELAEMQQELANQPPDPNAEFLRASAEQAEAEAINARADTLLKLAKTKESEANALFKINSIDQAKIQSLLTLIDKIGAEQPGNLQPVQSGE